MWTNYDSIIHDSISKRAIVNYTVWYYCVTVIFPNVLESSDDGIRWKKWYVYVCN